MSTDGFFLILIVTSLCLNGWVITVIFRHQKALHKVIEVFEVFSKWVSRVDAKCAQRLEMRKNND